MNLSQITDALVRDVSRLRFGPPVDCVYNPLEYARALYDTYLERFGQAPREVLLLGMNPGPWGMVQTGIPFGAVSAVRDWLRIDASVKRPQREHPARPVTGLACPREEVSGVRLWSWARDCFGTPERFFGRFFVANYCPLAFLEPGGRNLTPDKLPAQDRRPLLEACDRALRETVAYFRPRFVIGVGAFAEARIRQACNGADITIGQILHPSPASPRANRGWAPVAAQQLRDLGIHVSDPQPSPAPG
jgi:single-strand selective monofunctional uracil DNA glycosylase